MQNALPLHERLAVVTLLVLIFLFCLITQYSSSSFIVEEKNSLPHELNEIEVQVIGAVNHPGTYFIKKGTTVKDLLEKAEPLPNADLRKIKKETVVRHGTVIRVRRKPQITIYLKGAVWEEVVSVPKGTRLRDLKNYITFHEEADQKSLEKSRKLKDQEIIEVFSLKMP